MQEDSLFSISSPEFIVCRVFNDGHSNQCEVIPHCSFDLHLFNNGKENGNPLQYSCLENSMTNEPGGYSPWGHKESDTIE